VKVSGARKYSGLAIPRRLRRCADRAAIRPRRSISARGPVPSGAPLGTRVRASRREGAASGVRRSVGNGTGRGARRALAPLGARRRVGVPYHLRIPTKLATTSSLRTTLARPSPTGRRPERKRPQQADGPPSEGMRDTRGQGRHRKQPAHSTDDTLPGGLLQMSLRCGLRPGRSLRELSCIYV
jgi:hypothetical protein